MSIWVVASRKRGSGKTTIAMYINELLRWARRDLAN